MLFQIFVSVKNCRKSLLAIIHVFLKHENKDKIKNVIIIIGTAVLAWVITHLLKDITAHPRPDLTNALISPDSVYSFPSGHATFMSALALSVYSFDKKDGAFIFVFAVLSGIARALAGVHYWYDIIGGFVVGGIVAYVIILFTKNRF